MKHEFITHADLLQGRHIEFPLDETLSKNLAVLWERVNSLLSEYPKERKFTVSSGYRPGRYNTQAGGAPASRHLLCKAVDISDHDGALDKWLDEHPELLTKYKLSREDPARTAGQFGWIHLDTDSRGGLYITFKI